MKTLNLILTIAIVALSSHCIAGTGSQMSGTYTIGTSANANFKTIASAIKTLDNNGANGTVTFIVEKTQYSQTEIISALQNVSVINNVSFIANNEDNSTNTADTDTDFSLACK